jgi:monovalent cation/proton antiporter MnhG/PhaG subunit
MADLAPAAIMGVGLSALGLAFAAAAVIGLWRGPGPFRPAHAAALIDAIAWTLTLLGLALIAWNAQVAALIAVCLLIRLWTSALTLRAIARAAHQAQDGAA